MTDRVGPEPQYDVFADEFLAHARDGFYNAHYDRPACLELLGDVAGRTVLDAACGPGLYAQELLARGARVVGLDQSPRMVELSRDRLPEGDFRVHDLAEPLHWVPDASVDLVLFALALEYVDDRVAALREMRRALRPDGALVLSRLHPALTGRATDLAPPIRHTLDALSYSSAMGRRTRGQRALDPPHHPDLGRAGVRAGDRARLRRTQHREPRSRLGHLHLRSCVVGRVGRGGLGTHRRDPSPRTRTAPPAGTTSADWTIHLGNEPWLTL
ncbi:class I SAM-dependent methyltransferase [Nocardia sp. NPDC005366]|uniref:class I SAM-dependent methyltransferase n=1 Tax=Nocardia sp. NPDC005366 TaxID=3156878 RepID=UPI0033B89B1F